nr:diguanylate cyclase [Tissierella sp.]
MKLINNRFEITESLHKIESRQSYEVIDLKDESKKKVLTFYDLKKDKKIIAYYIENFISIYNIKHKNLLETYSFHIVETIDDKTTNMSLYFLVHGIAEGDFLYLKKSQLNKKERFNILLDLMNLIDFLHFRGITYKYLSPDNIFISSAGNARISSLGIISQRDNHLSYQTMTEHFIAPEIHHHLYKTDSKADYYSLGMIMKFLFLKDYKIKKVEEKDFLENLKFTIKEKKILIETIKDLTDTVSSKNLTLKEHSSNLIESLSLDCKYDLKNERNKINDRIKIEGRNSEIQQVLENDEILINSNKEFSGILFTGSKGIGKTRLLEELDFQLRIRDRENIRINIDSINTKFSINVTNLIKASIPLASKDLIKKYDLEFGKLFAGLVKEQEEDIYSKEYKNRYRLFNRIAKFFIEISKEKLLYIFIDDIHNSDYEFLSLIKYLLINCRGKNIFFIFTCLELSITVDSLVKENILDWIESKYIIRNHLKTINEKDFNNIIKSKFGLLDSNHDMTSLLYNASEGNLLKLDYIIEDLLRKEEIYINEEGQWESKINNYENEFRDLEIHHIFKKQLNKISERSLRFLECASAFDNLILEEAIAETMKLSDKDKQNIIGELLESKILKTCNNRSKYNFSNLELKRLIYHELSEDIKRVQHESISEFMLESIKKDETIEDHGNDFLKELSFQILKSNKDKGSINLILKKAKLKKDRYNIKSIDLWELAYSLIKNNEFYEQNYKTLYILKNLVEIYLLKGERKKIPFYIKELDRVALIQNNFYYSIKSKFYTAEVYFIENKLEEINIIITDILSLSKDHNILQGKILGLYLRSKLSLNLNNWKMLLDSAKELINISKESDKIKYLGNIYNVLGLYHKYNGDADKAIENYSKSIDYFSRANNLAEIIKPINNIAGVYADHLHDNDAALYYFEKGYKISSEYNLMNGIPIFSLNLGIIYGEKFEFDRALEYLKKADQVYQERKEFRGMFSSIIQVAINYLNKEDMENTWIFYTRAKEMFDNNKIVDVELTSSYYSLLSKIDAHFGNWDDALINIKIAKEAYKKNSAKYYWSSFLLEIYYKYSKYGFIDEDTKDKFFNIMQNYSCSSISNEILILLLKFCQLSMMNKENTFTNDLFNIYNKLKPLKEPESFKVLRKSIENNMNFSYENVKKLGNLNLEGHVTSVKIIVNFNLGLSFFKERDYKKAIYHMLKSLGVIFKTVEYMEDLIKIKSFIRVYDGDLIKKTIKDAIKLEFNKSIDYIKINDMEIEELYEYFNLKQMMTSLNNSELDSIFYIYHPDDNTKNIEGLLNQMNDDYKYNLEKILKYISYKTLAERGFIIIYDEDLNDYSILASLNERDVKGFNLNKLVHLDRERKGVLLNKNSLIADNRKNIEFISKKLTSVLGVPIEIDKSKAVDKDNRKKPNYMYDSFKGYIYLETESYLNKFNIENFKELKSLSKLIYLNNENYMLKNISTTDKLTGTLNRKYFESRLVKFIEDDIETDLEFTLLMIDIDNFKQINDSYGHLKGDEILKSLGMQFKENTRSTDLVCRYGGDEFIIALLNTNIEEGSYIAEKIRNQIENTSFTGIENITSLTIGASHYPTHSRFKKELIKKADDALYFAKHNLNKNTVYSWNPSLNEENIHLQTTENIYSGVKNIDSEIALNIIRVSDIIRKKEDISKKGEMFLEILMNTLVADELQLIFTNSFNIGSTIIRYKNNSGNSNRKSKYKLNIIQKALSNKKGGFYIDWENYDCINEHTGAPDWKSIMYVPLIKNDNICGIVYLTVSINKKEFNIVDFNLVKLLSNIFSANF